MYNAPEKDPNMETHETQETSVADVSSSALPLDMGIGGSTGGTREELLCKSSQVANLHTHTN